jgi:PD-(D/E)XK nuclease superfamily/Predicted AAA-ATPase
LFSGLNNVKTYSVLDESYSQYFGFTETEVDELLIKAKLPHSAIQTKEWYNGYNFAGTTIYNPWSIINFIKDEGKRLKSYWVNASGNELVKNIIIKSSFNAQEKIAALIAGNTIKEYIDEHIVFTDLERNPDAIWSLLLMSGYLKYTSYQDEDMGCFCELKLPNNEVENFYIGTIKEWLTGDRGFNWYAEFLGDLREGRVVEFEEKLQTLVEETLSYHDVSKKSQESFYHGMMLAFVSGLKTTHTVSSNKESGKGRYDIALIPIDPAKLGIIMEFKAVNDEAKLSDSATDALLQIKKSKYATELKSKGINRICFMGISFSAKAIKIATE